MTTIYDDYGNLARNEAVSYVREMMKKYPDAELTGNAAVLVKPEKGVIKL